MPHGESPPVRRYTFCSFPPPVPPAAVKLSPVVSASLHHSASYQSRKLEVRLVSGVLQFITLVSLVTTGMTDWFVGAWSAVFGNDVLVLLGVFLAVGTVLFAVRFPFAYYSGVVLERSFGLMAQSVSGWLKDGAKGALVGSVLGGIVVVALFMCMRWFGEVWWIPLGAFLFGLQMLLAVVGPRVLLPFFYTLKPLSGEDLRGRIERLCARAGIRNKGIFVIGFGEKTKKANAALTGLGPAKRIVLSDTLLQNLRDDEVEAVFAHEAGHLRLHHIWLGIASGLITSFVSLYLASLAYTAYVAASGSGIVDIASLPLLGAFLTLVSLVFGPASLALSRWQEYAADAFAVRLVGDPEPLANALEKLGRINLADPDPHPLLEFLTFSHPSLKNRLARIRG